MAGHSKWAQIKRHKAVVDAKRGVAYAQAAREIAVATRLGGADPSFNFRLRNAILRAKEVGMPNDNIQRAIERFTSLKAGANFEEIIYEGYGPYGVAVLVEVASDNRHRTAAELRLIFSDWGGNLGETGCVSWCFKRTGVISISGAKLTLDQLLDYASDLPIEDINSEIEETTESGGYILLVAPENLELVSKKLEDKGLSTSYELTYLPENTLLIGDPAHAENLGKLFQALEDYKEVSCIHHNAELP
ncbi:MAG: YebC/PmpR family DNA-binding transcriptional regulator [Candidatus Caenarcaniphilales bacterium]|nr:YebC/PmpR family DNA-binding transcriptional regulator [Candidatus Caenarcaniphilales bacterium]